MARRYSDESRLKRSSEFRRLMSAWVGWDQGADRASNGADVSSILPIIPYGGFSPVRLEDWHIRRDLHQEATFASALCTRKNAGVQGSKVGAKILSFGHALRKRPECRSE